MVQILSDKKHQCCGCGACRQICPKHCISMQEDEEGFLYPKVDMGQCTDCGLCESVCPMTFHSGKKQTRKQMPEAIGGWHIDDDIRFKSSSGGAFTLFAEYIIRQGGIVYGCALDENFCARHVKAESIQELEALRGSKYIQSDTGTVYRDIKTQLENKRAVLFTGTPCQASGLNSYLRKKYENLYICDFICHGVPSAKIFRSYVKYLEHRYHDKMTDFKFRNKDKGWHDSGLQMGTQASFAHTAGRRFFPGFRDAFMNGFLDNLYLRPSCYYCAFKYVPKYDSDITIADFWGVKKAEPRLYDGKGTSLILLNTKKGKQLFENAKDKFFYMECSLQDAVRHNQSLVQSAPWNNARNKFFNDYETRPFGFVKRKYLNFLTWSIHKILSVLFF